MSKLRIRGTQADAKTGDKFKEELDALSNYLQDDPKSENIFKSIA